jgi:hypothetical protein
MNKMETISSLSSEEISLTNNNESNESFYKEADRFDRPRPLEEAKEKLLQYWEKLSGNEREREIPMQTINTGINLIKESLILQVLEQKGVSGVPRVIRNEKDLPLSQSGHAEKRAQYGGYLFTSLGIEKIKGTDWIEHEFENENDLIDASIKAAKIFQNIYEAGFAHADIKPSNLMITQENEVIVVDFNASERHDGNGYFYTNSGTKMYIAPEHTKGPSQYDSILRIEDHESTADIPECKHHTTGEIYSLTLTIAEKAGADIGLLTNQNIAPETRRERFKQDLGYLIKDGNISEKLAVFIMWNSAQEPTMRDQDFSQLIKSLEMVKDSQVSTEDLYHHFNSQYQKREKPAETEK